MREYVYLRMAEGMVARFEEATQEAIHHFDFVRSMASEISDRELLSVANFWKGRCLRMRGEYEQALAYTVEGKNITLELGHAPMAAVMQVLESWLYFQKEDAKAAEQALREAHAVLRETDDYLTLGNIHSAYGRIARRQGHVGRRRREIRLRRRLREVGHVVAVESRAGTGDRETSE